MNIDASRQPYGPVYPFPREAFYGEGVYRLGPSVTVALKGDVTEEISAVKRLREGLAELGLVSSFVTGAPGDIAVGLPAGGELPAEGYRLEVTGSGAVIEGADRPGLFWGVVTLLQLLKGREAGAAIPRARITDWPRHPFRGVHVYIPAREDIPFFKRYIKYLLADHKMNTIFLEVGAGMELKKHPEVNEGYVKFAQAIRERGSRPVGPEGRFMNSTHHEVAGGRFISQEEMRDLVDYARAHQVDIIPEIQGLSHVYHLCASHKEIAEIPDIDWPDAYCPSNPATYELLFDVMQEYVEVMQPKWVHIGHDEWRAGGLCEKCKGRTAELFAQDVRKMHDWLSERGIGVMMWGDHYVPDHDGNAKSVRDGDIWYDFPQTYEAVESAPKDMILLNWTYTRGDYVEDDLAELGFKQVYGNFRPTHFRPEDWHRRSSKPYILGGEVSTWTAASEFCLGNDGLLHLMLYAANSLWAFHHLETDRHYGLLRDLFIPLREKLSGWSSPVLKAEEKEFVPIALGGHTNADVPGGLGRCLESMDGSPVVLAPGYPVPFELTGRCLQVRRVGEPPPEDEQAVRRARAVERADAANPGGEEAGPVVEPDEPPADAPTAVSRIPVPGVWRSLVFLHSAVGSGRHTRTFSAIGCVADCSEKIGTYRVHYQDGEVVEVEIRYGQNVARADLKFGRSPESISYDAVPLFLGEGAAQRTVYSYEWVNPRPDVAVTHVDFTATQAETAAAPLLLALTAVK